jgi:flavin reductase (DIM6/NTAB) family NADH-FMN oxidoreductase RutF
MSKNIKRIINQAKLTNVNKNIEKINGKELRKHLGMFATGVIIACARKNNFFAQKFFSDKFFNENFFAENNLVKKIEEFWHNFALNQNWRKDLIFKFFHKNDDQKNNNKESSHKLSDIDLVNDLKSSKAEVKNIFSENFLQKIKKIFADEFFGMTINSFTSISLNPSLISFCIDNKSANLKFFKKNRYFLLNILSEQQHELASAFATPKNSKKWTVEPYIFSKFGNPIFQNSLCFIECKKHKVIKMGDHHIIIGEVIDFAKVNDQQPLLYFSGKYRNIVNNNN